jgi:large subunit ribosomal protein L2
MKLKVIKKQTGGRNNQGVITTFHRGGGNKKYYRIIDFKRSLFRVPGMVKKIEKDPNRNSLIALIAYKNGLVSYILAPKTLKVGDIIANASHLSEFTSNAPSLPSSEGGVNKNRVGNAMPLKMLPVGSFIHNIEFQPGKGGQLMRSAGTFAKLLSKSFPSTLRRQGIKDKVDEADSSSTTKRVAEAISIIRLKSGRLYSISNEAMATLGIVSSPGGGGNDPNTPGRRLRKAGESRWRGRRPVVRGVAMNPVDHPHGGGEGKSKGGNHPVTP